MFLSELSVENFRGVRQGRLSFDDTTVLIGENDCGKSSLLDALARILGGPSDVGPPQFEPQHFHRTPAGEPTGPIRIGLGFRERSAGEWDVPELAGLAPRWAGQAPGSRRLWLRVTARPDPDGRPVTAEWEIRTPGGREGPGDRDPGTAGRDPRPQPADPAARRADLDGDAGDARAGVLRARCRVACQ